MIPDKNLFIVTSALRPSMGVFNDADRFAQTIATIKSLRNKLPKAVIVFADVSVREVPQIDKETIAGMVNAYIDLSQEPLVKELSVNGQKSMAENALMFFTLQTLKQHNLLKDVKRIFKLSARSELEDRFDIADYEGLFGKFVFKTRIPTWMNQPQQGATHLLITRMFSMCTSLVDVYLGLINQNLNLCNSGLDTEHAHFITIPKQYLVEFDKLKFWGWLAGNGQIEHY